MRPSAASLRPSPEKPTLRARIIFEELSNHRTDLRTRHEQGRLRKTARHILKLSLEYLKIKRVACLSGWSADGSAGSHRLRPLQSFTRARGYQKPLNGARDVSRRRAAAFTHGTTITRAPGAYAGELRAIGHAPARARRPARVCTVHAGRLRSRHRVLR